jgi:hypothetical protein
MQSGGGTEGSSGRALTLARAPARPGDVRARCEAAFLAHLIATAARAPQTRTKRRADPADAAAAYRLVAGMAG